MVIPICFKYEVWLKDRMPKNQLTFSLPYMTEISVVIRQWT